MKKITPCLWFDNQAEDAMNFYVSIFKNSHCGLITRYLDVGPGEAGSVLTVSFELDGQQFMALNGGPVFTHTPAISFFVNCDTQAEIDHFWEKLGTGGSYNQCGWLTDKFGVSWQIAPAQLGAMLQHEDKASANRAMTAMLKMHKLDIAELQRAFDGN